MFVTEFLEKVEILKESFNSLPRYYRFSFKEKEGGSYPFPTKEGLMQVFLTIFNWWYIFRTTFYKNIDNGFAVD